MNCLIFHEVAAADNCFRIITRSSASHAMGGALLAGMLISRFLTILTDLLISSYDGILGRLSWPT
jgi:hypothetical protein